MKDFQEEALRKLRPELVKKVNMDGLLTEMVGLDMLNKRECEKIEVGPVTNSSVLLKPILHETSFLGQTRLLYA